MEKQDIHIRSQTSLTCEICGEKALWLVGTHPFCEKHYNLTKEPSQLSKKDVQTLAECALRYALNRRTYITSAVSEAIKHIPIDFLSDQSVLVMRADLARYFEKRDDDECDFARWKDLDDYLAVVSLQKWERSV